MLRNKKFLVLLSTVLVLLITATGCGGGGSKKEALVVAQGADAKSLDPHASNDGPSAHIRTQIYNTLVKITEEVEMEPALAESWEKIDDTTWEFKLREGVKFHNDEELKASDVVFSLERMKESEEVAHIIEAIESVEAKDDYTVIIKTEEPFGPLLAHLSHPCTAILSEKAVTEAGDEYDQHPIGTGPFKFVDWKAGDKITLERFDDYFEGPANVKDLVFQVVPEATNRTIGLESGEIDIAYDIEPIDLERVEEHENLELISEPGLETTYAGFNCEKEPFDDPKVRQAINYAIDVDEIIDVVMEGAGKKAISPINENVIGYKDDLDLYDYNPEKAKELLKEAGYADGFTTTLWLNDENPVRGRIAEIIQAQLKEVNIDVELESVEWAAFLDRTAQGEHDIFILGWTTETGDADYGLYPLFHSSQHGGAGNRTFYTNSEVDKLLEEGRVCTDEKERLETYGKAQELIVEDAPEIFLYFENQNTGIQNYVKGFKSHPTGHHSMYNIEIVDE